MRTSSILLLFAMFLSISCLGQNQLTINDVTKLDRSTFDDENNTLISVSTLKEGVKLRIKKDTFSKAEAKNRSGMWDEGVLGTKTDDGTYFIYDKTIFETTPNSTEEIQLTLSDGSTQTLILKVSNDGNANENKNVCSSLKLPDSCKVVKNYDNKFGEDVRFYNDKTIVYVYDFNPDPTKRNFYKITKAKTSNEQEKNVILNIKLEAKERERKKAKEDFSKNPNDEAKENAFRTVINEINELKAKIDKSSGLKIETVNFNKETLTSRKNVKFKIYNVNRFMYDVSIADSVIHFDSEPSALFTRLFLGDSTLLSSLMGTFSDAVMAHNKKATPELIQLSKDIKCFLEKYNWLQNQLLNAYDPCYSFPCCYSIEYIGLANALIAIRADAVKIQQKIEDKKKIVAENKKKIEECDKYKADLEFTKKEIEAFLKKTTSKEPEKEDELKALRKKESDLNVKLCKDADSNGYKKLKEDTEKELSDMSATSILLSNLPSDQELRKVIVFLRNMVETNNSHTSDYISLNGNMLDLTINIASKDSIFKHFSIPEYKVNPLQIQIPILGKPFVSFSSGSFIALGKHLQNKTYAWQETVGNNNTATDSSYTLVESGYTLPPMGFCALGNLEWKVSRSFGLGGSFGVGLSIEKSPRLAYLGGVSLFFGNLRQFGITYGLVGMQVSKLTNNFQTVSDNQVIYASRPDIQYYKEFKVGHFISLTYTPFNTVYSKKLKNSKNK